MTAPEIDLARLRGWRVKLEEVGGWDNELQTVPAGGVRALIEDCEAAADEIEKLRKLVDRLLAQRGSGF